MDQTQKKNSLKLQSYYLNRIFFSLYLRCAAFDLAQQKIREKYKLD